MIDQNNTYLTGMSYTRTMERKVVGVRPIALSHDALHDLVRKSYDVVATSYNTRLYSCHIRMLTQDIIQVPCACVAQRSLSSALLHACVARLVFCLLFMRLKSQNKGYNSFCNSICYVFPYKYR